MFINVCIYSGFQRARLATCVNRCNQTMQMLIKLKHSVFNDFINQPNIALFISPSALMQNMFKLHNDDELLLAFIADEAVFVTVGF